MKNSCFESLFMDIRTPVERFEDLESPEIGERAASTVKWVDAGVVPYKDHPEDGWVRFVKQDKKTYVRVNGGWTEIAEDGVSVDLLQEENARLKKLVEDFEAALKNIQENSLECDKCSASLFAEQALEITKG